MENTTTTKTVHPLHPSNLANFYGTEDYTRHWTKKMVMTDGVVYLTQNGAAWMTDIIASVQIFNKRLHQITKGFQHWKFKAEGKGFVVTCDDGNGKIAYTQKGVYTDFPFGDHKDGEFSLYVATGSLDGVTETEICMLTSEY